MARALKSRDVAAFAARLRALRCDRGLTVRGLAARCNELGGAKIGQSYVGALERGERVNPSLAILRALAAALGTKVEYLVDGGERAA